MARGFRIGLVCGMMSVIVFYNNIFWIHEKLDYSQDAIYKKRPGISRPLELERETILKLLTGLQ